MFSVPLPAIVEIDDEQAVQIAVAYRRAEVAPSDSRPWPQAIRCLAPTRRNAHADDRFLPLAPDLKRDSITPGPRFTKGQGIILHDHEPF
jgi:hypothetical protein